MLLRTMLKSKIHRATVTQADLHYVGSVTIDEDLLDAADLLPGLIVDTSRMAANLAATKGLPLAEHVSSLLAGVLGGVQAHDLVAEAGARAVSAGLPLRDVLLAVPKLEERLSSAGITAEQIDSALEPSGYLGSASAFVTAALDAHDALEARDG